MCRNVGDRPTPNPVLLLLHSQLKTLAPGNRLASSLAAGRADERVNLCSNGDLRFLLDLAGLSAGARTGV